MQPKQTVQSQIKGFYWFLLPPKEMRRLFMYKVITNTVYLLFHHLFEIEICLKLRFICNWIWNGIWLANEPMTIGCQLSVDEDLLQYDVK